MSLPPPDHITWDDELYDPTYRDMHIERIAHADLSYPLFVTTADGNGRRHVIDGCHRLLKLYALDRDIANVIELTARDLDECIFAPSGDVCVRGDGDDEVISDCLLHSY